MNQQTIFTVYVLMQSQSDCDDAKRICEEYGLPMWDDEIAFDYVNESTNIFSSSKSGVFWISFLLKGNNDATEITLTRFKELCEEWKLTNH